MTVLVVIVHVIVSFIMIGVILLQSGKGAEIGAAFGGSSQTIFGSRGAATFLSKMTVATATLFMLTSLTLSILSAKRSVASSIVNELPAATTPGEARPVTPPTTTPQTPATPAEPGPPAPAAKP